ncbi:OLC1v1000321C1 [Oldenlandia corymbosa var. corymbosa]|uniref:OLC1v1000321C1 n=1 Tax=Oldenlandia corymbosa var. corymbosa TaxID=529605 RepID=A0AAV1D2Y7_OLDCO|nr:OLC1v1000321C1 [Oldenlandia corymbosa var. corymbosa]
MKCKKHITDLSSVVGVCASCLRERLFVLIAAQEQAQAALHQAAAAAAAAQHDDRRKSEAVPPPLVFPRSVSPYISRRKSDTNSAVWDDPRNRKSYRHQNSLPDRRFYSTPQVGPNGTLVAAVSCGKKKSGTKFSFFGYFFRSKSDKLDSNRTCVDPDQAMDSAESCTLPEASPSWFSSIFHGRRKKQSRTFSVEETATGFGQRRVCRNPDRGMSPARYSDDEDEHCNNGSSGYSSESSQPWKQTPRQTPLSMPTMKKGGGGRGGHSRNVSGMTFCLSPLVRASPSRHWNKKGVPPEMVVSGDIRVVPVKPPLTNPSSFCKNRSRKLADFGRFHQNR